MVPVFPGCQRTGLAPGAPARLDRSVTGELLIHPHSSLLGGLCLAGVPTPALDDVFAHVSHAISGPGGGPSRIPPGPVQKPVILICRLMAQRQIKSP